MFNVKKNVSVLIPRPRAKIFDPAAKVLISEPDEIIDQRVNYRTMSIESQIENGTVDKGADFSTFGVNPLDMSDAVSASMQDFNQQLDDKENAEKEQQEFQKVLDNLGVDTNN